MAQSFIFGGNAPGAVSYEEMKRQQELAQTLASRVAGSSPSNIGEGLSAIGAALAARRARKKATEAESAGRAQAADRFRQFASTNGIDETMADAYNNPYLSDGQRAIVNAVVQQKMAPPKPPELETLYDDSGAEYKGAWNPKTGQYDRIGGVRKKEETPVNGIEVDGKIINPRTGDVIYDPNGATEAASSFDPAAPAGAPVSAADQPAIPAKLPKGVELTTAQQNDLVKMDSAIRTLNSELNEYKDMVGKTGVAYLPGAERDAVATKRRNIQLQMKELYNLGVLNGPDLELMDTMLYDAAPSMMELPGAAISSIGGMFSESMGPEARAADNATQLQSQFSKIVNDRRKALGLPEMDYIGGGAGAAPEAQGDPGTRVPQPALPEGVSEDDIRFTMEKYGMSREEVLRELGN